MTDDLAKTHYQVSEDIPDGKHSEYRHFGNRRKRVIVQVETCGIVYTPLIVTWFKKEPDSRQMRELLDIKRNAIFTKPTQKRQIAARVRAQSGTL